MGTDRNVEGVIAGRVGRDVYRSRAWQRLRRAKLNAVNWRCDGCGRAGLLEVHHVVPLDAGGPPLPPLSGLEVLCPGCHVERHQGADVVATRRAFRELFARELDRERDRSC